MLNRRLGGKGGGEVLYEIYGNLRIQMLELVFPKTITSERDFLKFFLFINIYVGILMPFTIFLTF